MRLPDSHYPDIVTGEIETNSVIHFVLRQYTDNGHRIFASHFKGSLDPSHFIIEINVGKSRMRHRTTLKLNDEFLDRLQID